MGCDIHCNKQCDWRISGVRGDVRDVMTGNVTGITGGNAVGDMKGVVT